MGGHRHLCFDTITVDFFVSKKMPCGSIPKVHYQTILGRNLGFGFALTPIYLRVIA
jgi:hypothetical protein